MCACEHACKHATPTHINLANIWDMKYFSVVSRLFWDVKLHVNIGRSAREEFFLVYKTGNNLLTYRSRLNILYVYRCGAHDLPHIYPMCCLCIHIFRITNICIFCLPTVRQGTQMVQGPTQVVQ